MNNKFCPNCGKELPMEANFCPYCMTKLIAEDGTEIQFKKRINPKILWVIVLMQVVVIVCFIAANIFVPKILNKASNQNKAGVSIPKQENAYEDYLGVWYDDEHKDSQDILETGGKKIEICKVNGDEIVFSIASTSHSVTPQMARLDYLKVKMVDGKANFVFADDGFQNSGNGTITLKDGKVYAKVELDSSDYGGHWDLSMDTGFTRIKKLEQGQEIDIAGILDKYENGKYKLGQMTDVEKISDDTTYTFSNGITVWITDVGENVMESQPYISYLSIDYKRLESDFKYCYKGVDNTCTREQVEQYLSGGDFPDDGDVYYYEDEEYFNLVSIYFDSNGYVESITYEWT